MLKLTASITVTAAALMTLISADASAATVTKKTIAATASRGSAVMLNPQPLPPGPDDKFSNIRFNSVSAKALNPQPLPPGPDDKFNVRFNPMTAKALNPQPLPPGPSDKLLNVRLNSMSTKALNPQPLPPGPSDKMLVKSSSLALQNYKFAR